MRIWMLVAIVALAGCLGEAPKTDETTQEAPAAPTPDPHVIVATFDTGTNPFHPCWQRPGLDIKTALPWLEAQPLALTFADTYEASLAASEDAIAAIENDQLYHVQGTNLLYYGANEAADDFIDVYPHGAQASSQIGCPEFGMAPDAWVLILNWYTGNALSNMAWASTQDWIDVVHLNIQRITPSTPPVNTPFRMVIEDMVEMGQYVVLANGNGFQNGMGHIPSETIDFNSIPNTHLAGSNDGRDYTRYSNPDPTTVMDGCGTVAAAPDSFETRTFGGTSSASPRTTGYVAQLLLEARRAANATGPQDSLLDTPGDGKLAGPLDDGALTVAELHEVVRKTADPSLPASKWDEGTCGSSMPRYLPADEYDYHRVGYGKLTEDTLPVALDVLFGMQPMPDRATADRFYEASGQVRDTYWSLA